MKVLNVKTGDLFDAGFYDAKRKRVFRSWELKKDGTPDSRKKGVLVGIELHAEKDGTAPWHYYGSYVFAPDDDSKGQAIRLEIEEIEARLAEAEARLLANYLPKTLCTPSREDVVS